MRQFCVYILASHSRRVYIGVTNDLVRRVYQHREGDVKFTSQYQIHRLVHFELAGNSLAAISREKELKGWRRSKKVALIETTNPAWRDLSEGW